MKKFIYSVYKFGLRAQGRYGLLMSAMLIWALVARFPEAHSHVHMTVLSVLGLVVGAIMAIGRFTPAWLEDPNNVLKGGGVFVASGLVTILYILVGMMAVIPWQIEEPLSRSLAMLACVPTLVFANILGWSALIYGAVGGKSSPPPTIETGWKMPETSKEEVDLRSLRHSRMTR
ncbi:hypothetical protein [Ruegeria arenilitoris]|uniref:hypothetical protein n=1 Tax=Ruegeria arenilitoris TaxID=1173585 RepID=UPI0014805324|nr:hypothetical protein [Ruegeria arenilitoris]